MADVLLGTATYVAFCLQCGYVGEAATTTDINTAATTHLTTYHHNDASVIAAAAGVYIYQPNIVRAADLPA